MPILCQDVAWLCAETKKVRDALVAFMAGRLDAAWRTGCDGVDMDNVDAYDNVKPAGMIKVMRLPHLQPTQLTGGSRGIIALNFLEAPVMRTFQSPTIWGTPQHRLLMSWIM